MRRFMPALAAVLALGLTGCDHGRSNHEAAAPLAASPYTPRAVARAFARVGLPLSRSWRMEKQAALARAVSIRRGIRPGVALAAFFTDATEDVQVSVYRSPLPPTAAVVELRQVGQPPPATKIRGNVEVTYTQRGHQARQVARALTLLREARTHD